MLPRGFYQEIKESLPYLANDLQNFVIDYSLPIWEIGKYRELSEKVIAENLRSLLNIIKLENINFENVMHNFEKLFNNYFYLFDQIIFHLNHNSPKKAEDFLNFILNMRPDTLNPDRYLTPTTIPPLGLPLQPSDFITDQGLLINKLNEELRIKANENRKKTIELFKLCLKINVKINTNNRNDKVPYVFNDVDAGAEPTKYIDTWSILLHFVLYNDAELISLVVLKHEDRIPATLKTLNKMIFDYENVKFKAPLHIKHINQMKSVKLKIFLCYQRQNTKQYLYTYAEKRMTEEHLLNHISSINSIEELEAFEKEYKNIDILYAHRRIQLSFLKKDNSTTILKNFVNYLKNKHEELSANNKLTKKI